MKKWFGLMVLTLPVLVVCGQTTSAEEAKRSFRISNDPTEKLIYLTSYGGNARFTTAFTLYGDGRLVRDKVNKGNQEVVESSESMVAHADIESLVGLSVGAGLVDLTREALLESVGGRMPRVIDGRTALLRIRLEEYQGPAQPIAAPLLDHEIKIHAPSYLARSFPEHRAVRGLLELENALEEYAAAGDQAEGE